MSKALFISDYHFGHSNVIKFEDNLRGKLLGVNTIEEHDAVLRERTLVTVNKKDTLWVLGDNGNVGTTAELFNTCKARVINYIPGNHDTPKSIAKLASLEKVNVLGITKWKGFWVTHAPVHPQELRDKVNIHGHCHSKVVRDKRYVCVSVENCEGYPVWGQDIVNGLYWTENNFIS